MCGSCWAFAAAAQMSSYAKINNMSHALVELSPQHLVRYINIKLAIELYVYCFVWRLGVYCINTWNE